jgi:hypothetical protein
MNKYSQLASFLENQTSNRVQLSFSDIEEQIRDKLPSSAREHREWWANEAASDTRHRQCRAWQGAGWKVESADMAKELVVFRRIH